jgi:hypothetical protein
MPISRGVGTRDRDSVRWLLASQSRASTSHNWGKEFWPLSWAVTTIFFSPDERSTEGGYPMTDRVREILSWYRSENPGVLSDLGRMLNHGRLAGTGKMIRIYPGETE